MTYHHPRRRSRRAELTSTALLVFGAGLIVLGLALSIRTYNPATDHTPVWAWLPVAVGGALVGFGIGGRT